MALSDIDGKAVLRAVAEFDRLGRKAFLEKHGFGTAHRYFLRHHGKLYDSKAILGVAHGFSGGRRRALRPSDFGGGIAVAVRYLRKLGFEVEDLKIGQDLEDDTDAAGNAYWWVNNKQTHEHEISGNYLWSPTVRSDGSRNEFYENMKHVRPGDVVFAYAGAAIRAVGICTAPAVLAPKPKEFGTAGDVWGSEGWRVTVEFARLSHPLRPKDHMDVLAGTLPKKYSPIQANGNGNQVAYLAAVPPVMAQVVVDLLASQWNEIDARIAIGPTSPVEAIDAAEDQLENEIRNRTDIDATTVLQLVNARRGQGQYRKNLEGFEKACRLTGVTNTRHLRASHIKPWRSSSDFEKLDGNNGLLLSPHIDHLFDQGFITFSDDGALLVSPQADPDTLKRWGIDVAMKQPAFRPDQLKYLAFHREVVFRGERSS